LLWIRQVLNRHHSKDPALLKRVDFWINKVAMSTQKNAGWLCQWCRVMNGKHANHCHHCGGRWDVVGNAAETSYDQWEGWEQRGYSNSNQRGQWPKSPRKYGKNKGKGKGKSPRRHKNADKKQDTPRQNASEPAQGMGPPSTMPMNAGTTWMQAAHQITPAVQPPAATPAATTAAPALPPEYKPLIESLKRNQSKGTLPEDVQQEMKTLKVKEEKEQTKEMFQAVKSLSKARRELREAHDGRAQLHAQWRAFLALSVTQWQEFTHQFQTQEATAMRVIGEAHAALEEAKSQFEDSKVTAVSAEAGADVEVISEEDQGNAETNAMKLQDGLRNLTTSLQALSTEAERIHAEEQVNKKARLEGPGDAATVPGAHQLEPFALPGTKRPSSAGA